MEIAERILEDDLGVFTAIIGTSLEMPSRKIKDVPHIGNLEDTVSVQRIQYYSTYLERDVQSILYKLNKINMKALKARELQNTTQKAKKLKRRKEK